MKIDKILATDNLVDVLDEQEIRKIGSEVRRQFDVDKESRYEWEEKNKNYLRLAMQVMEIKNTPWPNASNVKYPLLTIAAIQFASRSYPALVQGNNVVRVETVGFDPDGRKQDAAVRIGKHMSYQLLHQMKEWEESMDRMLFVLPIIGTGFKKTYFDSFKGRNVSEYVHPYDLVVNYNAKDLASATQKTHILSFDKNEIIEAIRAGFYADVNLGKGGQKVRERLDQETQGIKSPYDDADNYDVLEAHCWYDVDGDGYKEPYIVSLLYPSNEVLRIAPRFIGDAVTYNDKNEIARIEADEYFTNYVFIPDPESGIYGLGYGALLGPLNEAVNTVINQLIDSGTLNNSSSGFLSRSIRLGRGDVKFKPYEWKYTNSTAEDLHKGIFPLPVNPPSTVLFSLLGTLIDSGQRLSSTMDIMMGENPGQNQPATTTMAVIEQGTKVYTSIHKRTYRSFKEELSKLFKLNSIFLEDEEYFKVLDIPGKPQVSVARMDYDLDNMDVFPAADPNVVTQSQKLLKAEALLQLLPTGLINPQEVIKRMLEAQEQPSIEALLQAPPPQPDPKIVLEQEKFKHQVQVDGAKLELDAHRIASEAIKDEAQALLSRIKAEGLLNDAGREDLKLEVDTILKKKEIEKDETRVARTPAD